MLKIRKAEKKDVAAIRGLIEQLDLAYPGQTFDNFWVAEENGKVVGIADLKESADIYFLSSVGTDAQHQRQGFASEFLKELLKGLKKDVYLYTIIPGFFSRLGFKAVTRPSILPVREIFNCSECQPEKCVCMVKKP
jgi:N-acetylglutamate synthase-like GNAT family acetyltransferase